jgi:hypothetical protein
MNTVYKIAKVQAGNDEAKALKFAIKKLGVDSTQLKAEHTPRQFTWSLLGDAPAENSTDYPFGLYSVAKNSEVDYKDAKQQAMQHFDTFEANIVRVESEEDEEHYVFTKVRG